MRRLEEQARELNVFDAFVFCDELSLDHNFVRARSKFFAIRTRGFGYWTWKPHLIEKVLRTLNDGDVLVYSDVGNQFVVTAQQQLMQYITLAAASPSRLLAPRLSDKFLEREWTKLELFRHFGVDLDVAVVDTSQFEANFIVIINSQQSRNLVRRWNDIHERFIELFDDTYRIPQLSCFREHRHDQSVFSILCKLYEAVELPPDSDDFVMRVRDRPMSAASAKYFWFLIKNGLLFERLTQLKMIKSLMP